MICCLARGVVLDHVLKAFLALSTAASISSMVEWGTLVTTWLVAGLCTSIHLNYEFHFLHCLFSLLFPVSFTVNPLSIDDILSGLRDLAPSIAQPSSVDKAGTHGPWQELDTV